ncbi:hypothetical protein AUK40_02860 [Candidatus Wirthbacteria bacterium CG2_30_54_11]|uniref:Phage shock protein PspC N-terminal domain-containing protein n=1 Tax=Candidatus Wirthbacteria bacterium CG2_30_54_11 TaxID=1817892 RepID=A0A1J5IT27_9BACT|nr:MAG: hypothetical protein AUK40_02860 [Candidatus Wirthbacteria bacterium CG2_30_54_11]
MTEQNFDAAFAEMSLTREARKVLNDYLKRLETETASLKKEERDELVRDIQEHLYNALEAKLKKSRSKKDTLDAQIVMEVLSALGEPTDYLESAQTAEGIKGSAPVRRIRRAREGRIFGGVAMGMANYFRIDVVIVRVIMIGLVLTGISAIIYPVLWLVIPEETEGEAAVSSTTPEPTAKRPRWVRGLIKLGWKLLLVFVALCFYLPVLAVLLGLTLSFFAIPLAWLFHPSNFWGFNTLALLGYLLPIVSVCLGAIFLTLLLLFLNFIYRVHFKRSLLRGNSLKYLGGASLIAICLVILSSAYTLAGNWSRGSITETRVFPAGQALDIEIVSEVIAGDITVTGSDTVEEITLTETRKARGYSIDNARRNAGSISTTPSMDGDKLTLATSTSNTWVNHNATVEYRLLVPSTMSLSLHNPIGRTIIEDIDASTITVDNEIGSLEVKDSWADQADFRNNMGMIEISRFAPPALLLPLSSTMEQLTDDIEPPRPTAPLTFFTISNNLGAIRLEAVTTDSAVISGDMGSLEIDTCSFRGNISNNMGSISISDHTGALSISNSMGAVDASFLALYDGEEYKVDSSMGSVVLDLPPGLDPVFDISSNFGSVDRKYRTQLGGPRPHFTITSDMGSVEIR